MTKKEYAAMAKDLGVKSLFVNSKGEVFTVENLAHLSEGGDKSKVETLQFESDAVSDEDKEAEAAAKAQADADKAAAKAKADADKAAAKAKADADKAAAAKTAAK